jgi:hypothetical protein
VTTAGVVAVAMLAGPIGLGRVAYAGMIRRCRPPLNP